MNWRRLARRHLGLYSTREVGRAGLGDRGGAKKMDRERGEEDGQKRGRRGWTEKGEVGDSRRVLMEGPSTLPEQEGRHHLAYTISNLHAYSLT